jgi:hypothetical protein
MQNLEDNNLAYEVADGGWRPPKCLRKLYWHVKLTYTAGFIGGFTIFLFATFKIVPDIDNTLLGTALAFVPVGAYLGLLFLLARIRQMNLEREIIGGIPHGWHLIYRQRGLIIKNSGRYLPDVVDDAEYKKIFSKPFYFERRCLLEKLGRIDGPDKKAYCQNCGYLNENDSLFCGKCGRKLRG